MYTLLFQVYPPRREIHTTSTFFLFLYLLVSRTAGSASILEPWLLVLSNDDRPGIASLKNAVQTLISQLWQRDMYTGLFTCCVCIRLPVAHRTRDYDSSAQHETVGLCFSRMVNTVGFQLVSLERDDD